MADVADVRRAAAGEVACCAAGAKKAWTPSRVEARLRKAVAVQAELTAERQVPDVGLVAPMTEALSWLRWLEPDDAGIVLGRLDGAPWKAICFAFGISRPTADRRYRYALALIAWRLNGNARTTSSPSLRSLLGMRRAA